ncbi:hypothetical protein [Rhodopseudomonas sp. RCAM05734]|uniref:hypothetical protein n=1 Tax=Rhodopseudomonas sp. RCAM05734 TaxID=3457549 RepID=UPI004043C2C0
MSDQDLHDAVCRSLQENAKPGEPARDSLGIAVKIAAYRDESVDEIQTIVKEKATRLGINVL